MTTFSIDINQKNTHGTTLPNLPNMPNLLQTKDKSSRKKTNLQFSESTYNISLIANHYTYSFESQKYIPNNGNNLEFIYNKNTYLLTKKYKAGSGATATVSVYYMYRRNKLGEYDYIKRVVIKKFRKSSDYDIEKHNAYKLKHVFAEKNKNVVDYNKHFFLFNDDVNLSIIYNYLGAKIRNDFIYGLTLKQKVSIMIQLFEQCIKLHNYCFIHNDIKPENIVIDFDDNGEPIISIIDYGILYYFPEDLNNGFDFNTTIWSGSPEYLIIAELNKTEQFINIDDNIKNLFFKSQHFALGGIMIGILVDEILYYFDKIIKYVDVNEDEYMPIRFMKYDQNLLPLILGDIIKKLNQNSLISEQTMIPNKEKSNIPEKLPVLWTKNKDGSIKKCSKFENEKYIFGTLKLIIYTMFEYDYKNRLSLDEILIELKKTYSLFNY